MARHLFSVGPIENEDDLKTIMTYMFKRKMLFQNPANVQDFPFYTFVGNVSFVAQKKPSRRLVSIAELLLDKLNVRRKLALNNSMPKDIIPMLDR